MNARLEAARMPQLDGLRAFAVAAVAVSHWTPGFLGHVLPWGTGVQLFFVLSGFLITGILLRSRPDDLGLPMASVLRVFYMRRILRIFPVYYGVIAFSLLFGVANIESTWSWHVPYLSNVYYALHGHGSQFTDPFLHLWSLSVEEQFYLLWPLVALIASRRSLAHILQIALVTSLAFRVGISHAAPELPSIRYLTPSCLDAFAAGGLMAHAQHYSSWRGVRRLVRTFAWIGGVGLVLSVTLVAWLFGPEDGRRVGHTFLVIIYGAIVGQAAVGFGGVAGRVLTFKPILYLGRISYGLYVYHYFAALAISAFAARFGLEEAFGPAVVRLPAYIIFTMTVAVISWHLYELPINRLKRHFEYPTAGGLNPALKRHVVAPVSNG